MMKVRKIINILSTGIIGGFIVGFTISVYQSIVNLYIKYKMLRIVAFNFQKYLNQWIILSVIFLFALFIVSFIVLLLENRKLRSLLVCIVCFMFLFLSGWAINHYWLPHKFHPVSLLADSGILLFTLFLGWILLKIKGETLLKLVNLKYIRRTALALFIFQLLLNIGIIIDAKVNIPKGPNVILISIDTLRADHLGCYGYETNTSPYIDRFSKESVLFTNARSQSSWTVPSHLSLFTSLYPSVFKVWEYPDPGRLPNHYFTLAEILRNEGYVTAAFTAGAFVHRRYGFKQGFDTFMDEITPNNITTIFNKFGLDWIKRGKNKFMIFLHCYEPHAPYNPPMAFKEEFASMYTPTSQLTEAHYYIGADSGIGRKTENWFKETEDMNFLKTVIGLYDGEIRYVDSEIEKLFNELKEMDVFENCLVIFLSDHGEAFYEHNSFSHCSLYDEILHVPLIIHLPKTLTQYNRKSIDDVVSLIDVLPTILDICQIPYSPNEFQGTSLLNLIKDKGPFPMKYSFSERLRCRAIAGLEFKLKICMYERWCELEEFYNIDEDPGENHNLLQTEFITPKVKKNYLQFKNNLFDQVDKNKSINQNMSSRDIPVRKIEMDEKTKEKFRSLGYVQ